jgi:phosphate:Na+ symporter
MNDQTPATKNSLRLLFACLAGAVCVLSADLLSAANTPTATGNVLWTPILLGLGGGLAFFLYGLEKMSKGIKKAAGNRIRSILASMTRNNFIAMVVGAIVTMIIQSSSATTVMLVSFVQAGLMSFSRALGIILGANIGTTVTAQLVAFKITDFALVMVLVGVGLKMIVKDEKLTNIGNIMLGFGMLFFGMKLMGNAMEPLRTYAPFIEAMQDLRNPLAGIAAGALFTALVQSSSATTGIVIVLAQQDLISLEAGIAIIIGANIGTCVTAILAGIGASREAKRVAIGHVLFNVGGALLFILWIPQFAELIRIISERFDFDTARQIANAHTIFNIAVGLVFLPFISLFAWLIIRILPDASVDDDFTPKVRYLDDKIMDTPALALQIARSEIKRMLRLILTMHRAAIIPFINNKSLHDKRYPQLSLLEGIEMREKKVNFLEDKIRLYLLGIGRNELGEGQGRELNGLLSMLNYIELMGDIITRQIVPLSFKKKRVGQDFSPEGKMELISYHKKIAKQLKRLQSAMVHMDKALAQHIKKKKKRYALLEDELRDQHMQRLRIGEEGVLATHTIHVELMYTQRQMNHCCVEIARVILESNGDQNGENY